MTITFHSPVQVTTRQSNRHVRKTEQMGSVNWNMRQLGRGLAEMVLGPLSNLPDKRA